MKSIITVEFDSNYMHIVDRQYNGDRLKKYIITMARKHYSNIIAEFEENKLRRCPCGRTHSILAYRNSIKLVEISPTEFKLDLSNLCNDRDKSYGQYYACCKPGCFLKTLNANSAEYIKHAYKLGESDAAKLILSRNKSPFYSINHSDEESYVKFQSHSNRTKDRQSEITESWKKSCYSNKAEFIKEYGQDAWDKKESESRNIYNLDKFPLSVINERKLKTSPKPRISKNGSVNFSWIRSNYGSYCDDEAVFKEYCLSLINASRSIIGFCMLIHKAERSFVTKDFSNMCKYSSRLLALKCTYGIDDLYEYFDVDPNIRVAYKNYMNVSSYSYASTADGHFFRSALELNFYYAIKDIQDVKIIDTNKKYPGKDRKFYDIKISYKGIEYIIELCSCNSKLLNPEYCENVEAKASEYNSILVYNRSKFIDDLQHNRGLTNEYY